MLEGIVLIRIFFKLTPVLLVAVIASIVSPGVGVFAFIALITQLDKELKI